MIRRRVAVILVAGVAIVLTAGGVLAVNALEDRLVADVDQQLEGRVLDVARATEGRAFPQFPADRRGSTSGRPGRSPFEVNGAVFVLVDADGAVAAAISTGPASDPDPLPDLDGVEPDGRTHTVAAVEGSSLRYRVVGTEGDAGALFTGLSLADVDESIDSTRQILLVAGGLALIAVAALASVVIRRGLRPIDDMIGTAERIADGELSERATVVNPNDEVGHLGLALNSMLDRISEAADAKTKSEERLRRFVADASHELRTPLTSIRGYAELSRTGEHDVGLSERSMQRIEEEAIRMGVLVEDLLLLARFDQGRPIEHERVDLVRLVGGAVDDARVIEPSRVVDLDLLVPEAFVVGDEHRLRQVLDNLLGNVRAHTEATTPAQVSVKADDGSVIVTVSDDGAGMTDDQMSQAFERFWQADPSGGEGRRGTGLGLAIVAEIVKAHEGTVDLDSDPARGTTVTVRLPQVPQA